MNAEDLAVAKFRLGRIVCTANVLAQVPNEDILLGIKRHQAGDWGDLPVGNKGANDRALAEQERIWSVYCSTTGVKFWLITEADRRHTTVLLPEDY